jgi:hypothetical protein
MTDEDNYSGIPLPRVAVGARSEMNAAVEASAGFSDVILRGLDDRTLFRISEGDQGAIPVGLRSEPPALIQILARLQFTIRQRRSDRWHDLRMVVIGALAGAIIAAIIGILV